MAIREVIPDKNDALSEPRMKSVIVEGKTAKRKKLIQFAIAGIEIVAGTILTDYMVTKKPNTNMMFDVLGTVVGVVLVYDGLRRIIYK